METQGACFLILRLWVRTLPVPSDKCFASLGKAFTGADPGYVKRGGRDPKGGGRVADITPK